MITSKGPGQAPTSNKSAATYVRLPPDRSELPSAKNTQMARVWLHRLRQPYCGARSIQRSDLKAHRSQGVVRNNSIRLVI